MKTNDSSFPSMNAPVYKTAGGTSYLKEPGVALIAATATNLDAVQDFLDGFDKDLGFSEYLSDVDGLTDGDQLVKFAGQLCYLSLGANRTKNLEVKKYLDNIKASGHGSVLEHVSLSMLFWGVSRSWTHEAVRHRAGTAFSQVSQRYVDGKVLRFVERPEYAADPYLHDRFEARIDMMRAEYDRLAERLMQLQEQGDGALSAEHKRDLRKKVNQAARSCLPNETEAPIVLTANVRAWRHMFEMRAAFTAEVEMGRAMHRAFTCIKQWEPELFGDYEEQPLVDGRTGLTTKWRKV